MAIAVAVIGEGGGDGDRDLPQYLYGASQKALDSGRPPLPEDARNLKLILNIRRRLLPLEN